MKHFMAFAAGLLALAANAHAAGDRVPVGNVPVEAPGGGPDVLSLGMGASNVIRNDDQEDPSAELRLECRFGVRRYGLGPIFGVLANRDGALFGYAALYADLRIGEHWIVTPAGGLGAYEDGDGTDLGGVFQFHLGLDLAYRLENGGRVGLKLAHISNARLHRRNPGTESLLLAYTVPLGRPF